MSLERISGTGQPPILFAEGGLLFFKPSHHFGPEPFSRVPPTRRFWKSSRVDVVIKVLRCHGDTEGIFEESEDFVDQDIGVFFHRRFPVEEKGGFVFLY